MVPLRGGVHQRGSIEDQRRRRRGQLNRAQSNAHENVPIWRPNVSRNCWSRIPNAST